MATDETTERLSLFWLNSMVTVPSALLTSSLSELKDGKALCDLIAALQHKWRTISPHAPQCEIDDVPEGIQWLCDSYGYSSLPAELTSVGAVDRIYDAHKPTLLAFVAYLKQRFDECDLLGNRSSSSLHRGSNSLFLKASIESDSNTASSSTARDRRSSLRGSPARRGDSSSRNRPLYSPQRNDTHFIASQAAMNSSPDDGHNTTRGFAEAQPSASISGRRSGGHASQSPAQSTPISANQLSSPGGPYEYKSGLESAARLGNPLARILQGVASYVDYNGTSPAAVTVTGAGANRRRDTSSNDDNARGRLSDQHLDGGGGNARTSALSAAAAGGIGKDGPYEYDPSASGASQFGWIGAGFKFEGVADTSFGQDDYHMHHAIKELSREPAPSSSSSSAAQQRKAAVNAATDTTGAGRGVSSRGPSTAPIASPASGAAPSIQSSKSALVQLSHPPSGSRSSVSAVRPLGQPQQQQQHNAPQMEHHQHPEQQHVDRHQHHQQHGGSDDRGSVISEASLAPSLTRLRAAAEQAIAAAKVMQDRSERADYEAYQQRVKEQWSRAHGGGGAAGTGASAAQPAEAASVAAASHYNVRRSSVMSRATALTSHTQASAAGRNVSSSSSAQHSYLQQQQQVQSNTSREREWNGSTEMPSGPGLQGAASIPASSVDRERERSATHAKAVNVLQLSPARARVVQLQASAVSSGSAAARPPLPPTGAQPAPGAAPALSAAGPANTAVTGSNVSPSAGGAVSGIKVGSLVDPSYVPRIALPVSAAVPVLPPSINRRSMVGGSSSSGAGQNASGSQASGGGVVAASANNSGSGNMILNFSTASAGTSGSAQQMQQAVPAPAEAPKPVAASAAATESDEFSLCSPKQKVMLKWIRSLGVEISPEMRCAYSVVSQAEVLECLAESAHRRGSVYGDEERTFQRYFSGIDEGYGERDGDDAATASGAGRRSKFDPALLPRMLCDGIFLSELVCACESRSGNRTPTMQMRIPGYAAFRDRADGAATETGTIGGWHSRADARSVVSGRTGATSAFTGHGGSTKSGMLTLVPGTVLPRDNSLSPAAAVKNIELALEILRARPRVNSRYLWSGDDLRRGLSIDTAWGILEDLHRAYGGVTRTATSPSKKRQQQLQEQAQSKAGEAPAESGESAPQAAPSSTAAAGSGEAPEVDEASVRQQHQQAVLPLGNAQLLPPHLMAAGAAAGGSSVASHHQHHHVLHVSDLSSAHGMHGAVAVSIVTGAANGADIQVDGTQAKFVLPAGKFNVGAGELAVSSSSGASVAGDGDGTASVAPSISGASASAIDRKYSKRRVLPILPDPLPVPEHLLVHLPALASALGVDPRAHAAAVKAHHQQQQQQQKTRANAGGTQAGAVGFAKVTELQISEVRTWLHSLELSNVAPLNEEGVHHVLDNPLFNGCLLAAIMKTIAPDTPPLCGPKPYRHFEKPKSFAEARANNEASLRCLKQCPLMTQTDSTPLLQAAPDHQSSSSSVGRGSSRDGVAAWNSSTRVDGESPLPARHAHLGYGSSTSDHAHVRNLNVDLSSNPSSSEGFKVVPPPTIPELYLYCCEEMLVGNHDAAWGLLWHICRLHSYRRQVELAKAELLRPVSATSVGFNGGQAAGDEAAPPASPSRRSARSSASGGGGGAGGVRFDLSSNTYVSIDGRAVQPPMSPGKRYNMTEVQVMEWLAGMGLYRALGLSDADVEILERANSRADGGADAGFGSISSRKSGLHTIDYIIGPLCDGTLLADIARILLAGIIAQSSTQSGDAAALSGKDSIGNSITADVYLHQPAFASAVSALSIITSVDPSPRTEAVAMSNIQKSIEALRSIDGLSRRWTTKPDIVHLLFQGQPEAACGLLFDCMSFARSRRITGKLGFGSSSGNNGRSSSRLRREAEQIAAAEALAAAQARAARQARRRLSYDTGDDGAASVASSVRSRKDAASLLSLDAGEDRSKAGRTSLEDEEAYAARIAAGAAGTASDGQGTGSSGPNFGKAEGSAEPAGIPGPESDATIDGAILVRWLSSLDIFVTRPDDLAITAQSAPEFSDGVLLCRVIEACENMRGFNRDPIPGVDRYPTTGAAKLGNIRKGLAVLRSHPSMPLELLWSEGKIREAHAPTIRKLLAQIRRAYGHHLFSHYHDLHPKPEAHEASPLRRMAAVGVSPAARGLQLQSDEPHAAGSAARNAVTGTGAAASSSAAASAIARSASASRRQSVQSVGSLPPSGRRQPG